LGDLLYAGIAASGDNSNVIKAASARGQGFFYSVDSENDLHVRMQPAMAACF
jgi:hypothetical protein